MAVLLLCSCICLFMAQLQDLTAASLLIFGTRSRRLGPTHRMRQYRRSANRCFSFDSDCFLPR